MTLSELRIFLTDTMSMSEVYQPVIIKELLENDGTCSKEHLAARLADHDASVQEYYQKILMRWPKTTLTKHGVVEYDQASKSFVQLSTVSYWVCGACSFELPSVVRKPSRMHKSRFTRRVERLFVACPGRIIRTVGPHQSRTFAKLDPDGLAHSCQTPFLGSSNLAEPT